MSYSNPVAQNLSMNIVHPESIDRYFEVFFDYVRLLVDIPLGDQAICLKYFKPIAMKKDTIIAREDTVHEYHNFIVAGFMRIYHVDHEGDEITTEINDGPRFMTSYNHFVQRTPSNENLHCITDCEILRIRRDDVDASAKEGETQLDYSLKVLQQAVQRNKQRVIDMTTLSAEERYVKLMDLHPAMIQHVPLKYIASYLGINPGSLSRIRSSLG